MKAFKDEPSWAALHQHALSQRAEFYTDPATGYRVFTELFHLRRGKCCASACRHCPFGHERVASSRRAIRSWAPTLISKTLSLSERTEPKALRVVFWSGGKDSFLAWQESAAPDIQRVWLTTYDPIAQEVPVQNIPVSAIIRQAELASQPLVLIPQGNNKSYQANLVAALSWLNQYHQIKQLVFGDIDQSKVRAKREELLSDWAARNACELSFPLWYRPQTALLEALFQHAPPIRITSSSIPQVKPGDYYTAELVARLPEGVHPLGEQGEFHTIVELGAAELLDGAAPLGTTSF